MSIQMNSLVIFLPNAMQFSSLTKVLTTVVFHIEAFINTAVTEERRRESLNAALSSSVTDQLSTLGDGLKMSLKLHL